MIRRGGRSIRLRVAVAGALIAAAVLGVLALLAVDQARGAAAAAATQLALDDLRPYRTDLLHQPDERPDQPSDGVLVLVVAPDGAVARSSMPSSLAAAAREVDARGDVRTGAGRFRVVAERVRAASGSWRLIAARDLTASDDLLAGVRMTLLVGAPVAVLAVAFGGWVAAGVALRPVHRMRDAAERLRRPGSAGALPADGGAELAELGATLNGLVADLRAAVEHERRTTADAAHELRTPLAVLVAQVEQARRRASSADLDAVHASAQRLSRLTDDLLALARADSASDAVGSAMVADLVTETMAAVDRGRVLAGTDVLVDLELDADLDESASVRIDEVGFGRVLTNLIANAIDAGPGSSVLVRLRGSDELVLQVVDDGPGVPPAFLPHAFDRFARTDQRSGGEGGAGLGLALVARLAQRAGGSARLENRREGGAVATVRLPHGGAEDPGPL